MVDEKKNLQLRRLGPVDSHFAATTPATNCIELVWSTFSDFFIFWKSLFCGVQRILDNRTGLSHDQYLTAFGGRRGYAGVKFLAHFMVSTMFGTTKAQ